MAQETIKVDGSYPPKSEGGQFGSIKHGLRYYSVPESMRSQFARGQSYLVEYETKDGGGGKVYYNIKKIIPTQQPAPAQPSTERPASGYGSNTQAREIFVTGTIGRYLGGPGMTGKPFPSAEQVEQMIRAAELGWKLAHYNAQEGELDDEIPF